MADERVKQVKEANDIVDVVGSYIALRPAGPYHKGLCPFHDDHNPSLQVDPKWQNFRCWSCGKYGDVISFVQEYDRISFAEALELLARRAGITLEKHGSSPHAQTRARMLDVARWAAQQFHDCLLNMESPEAEAARAYLGQRGLTGETVRRYLLGYAPPSGNWLVQKARAAGADLDVLEKVGLIARRSQGAGFYDRFRDRVQFPIRDVRGQVVGFGGRILPTSPLSSRGPKYYNSSDTPLFNKSELLYGLDQARHAAAKAGYLAVVEGYTDVLMAHQLGVGQVVATMGTALNARHVQHLRRFAPRVVLVFDADAGGQTGVDRALDLFASHDVDLAIATLPEGLDPCDLLVKEGGDAFRQALEGAVDALEFKLNQTLPREGPVSVEESRRAVDAVLGVIALAPPLPGQAGAIRAQLMVTRIAHRLALTEKTVWKRLDELRKDRQEAAPPARPAPPAAPKTRAAPEERELLEVLLAEPALVPVAMAELRPDEIQHDGARRLLQGLYQLQSEGEPPTVDGLRVRLDDAALVEGALKLQDIGRRHPEREAWLRRLLAHFEERRARPVKEELQNQLHAASDHQAALELLRRLQTKHVAGAGDAHPDEPDTSSLTGVR